jgi:hypothetical protein
MIVMALPTLPRLDIVTTLMSERRPCLSATPPLGVDHFAYLPDVLDRVCTHPARRVA